MSKYDQDYKKTRKYRPRKSTSIDRVLANRHGYPAYKKAVKKHGGKKIATPSEYMDAKIYRFWKHKYKIQPGATGQLRS